MKKVKYAASAAVTPHSYDRGRDCHSATAWMRQLLCRRFSTWRPLLNRTPPRPLKSFTPQGAMRSSLFPQHRCVSSQATPSDAGAPAEKLSPWEKAFEEALYMGFTHQSVVGVADSADTTPSSDLANKNVAIRVAPCIEDPTESPSAAAIEVPEDTAGAGITGSETLSVTRAAKSTPLAQTPRENPRPSSGVSSPPLLPSVSQSEEERRMHRITELAFEQALYGDPVVESSGDGGATGSHSTKTPDSTLNTPTERPTGEAAGVVEESREGRAVVATGVATQASPKSFPPPPSHLPRGGSAELSKSALSPLQASRLSEEKGQPMSATTVTMPRAAFESAEAAFESALYGDLMVEPLSGKAKVLVPSDASIAEAGREGSTSTGAPPLLPTTPTLLGTPASTRPYPDAGVADALICSPEDVASCGVAEEKPASDIRESKAEKMPQGRGDVRQLVESPVTTGVPATADGGGADRVAVKEAIPPPTVSMRCVFSLDRRDSPADQFALFNALFRVTDHHTTVVTHIDPEDRVRRCMPLLDRVSKRELFFASEWVLDLERADGTNTAPPSTESAAGFAETSAPPPFTHREVIGRSKVLRTLVFRLLRVPHRWWDQVQELVLLAVKEAAALHPSCTTAVDAAASGEDTSLKSSGAGADDAAASVVMTASDTVAAGGVIRDTTAEDVQAAMTRVFSTDPQQVHFFSDALREVLAALGHTSGTDRSLPAFEGPLGAWKAFVLTQRHLTTGVCGPHTRPFSFGEGRPTITTSDLAPLQYCEAAASWDDPPSLGPLPCATAVPHRAEVYLTKGERGVDEAHAGRASLPRMPSASTAAVDAITMAWDKMSEEEQNTFLFGAESAQLSQRVRELGGVYAVFGQNNTPFEMESMLAEAEAAAQLREAQEKEEAEAEAAGVGSTHALAEASLLEVMRDREAARVRAYDVDRVVLELTNGEGVAVARLPGGRSTFLSNLAAASSARGGRTSRQQGDHGRISAVAAASNVPFQRQLQNNEDVQLAALWQRFTRASTGDLIGNLLYVRRHASLLVHEAMVDVAVQKAFWLLFFARDEVRAVTHPKRTYETLWNLHHQLVSLFVLPSTDGSPPSPAPGQVARSGEDAQAINPAFESLSLHSQVSYACFGCAHVLPQRGESAKSSYLSTLVTEPAGVGDSPITHSGVHKPYASPKDLYAALTGTYTGRVARREGATAVPSTSAVHSQVADSVRVNFETLSAFQQLAVAFCFPRNDAERDEAARLVSGRSGITAVNALTTTTRGAADAEGDPQNERGEPSLGTGSHLTSEGKLLDDGCRAQPSLHVEERIKGASKVKTHDNCSTGGDTWLQQVQCALEGSVYECLRSLRAAGVLATPLPSPKHRFSDTSVILATFSNEQRRKVQRAVQDITATMIEGDTVESSVGAPSLAREVLVPAKAEIKQHLMPPLDSTMADALASPRRRGRKARTTANTPLSSAMSVVRDKRQQVTETMPTNDLSLRRKRGRKPRAASCEGIDSAPEKQTAAAVLEKTKRLKTPSMKRSPGHRGRNRGGERQESGVTNEEVARVMALFCEGAT
ncbi:hypothetical protein MNV84_05242 [Leishmania braziliensis]|nr:hypothetical protein MNV84_05242 [Leishmania braziliensis]